MKKIGRKGIMVIGFVFLTSNLNSAEPCAAGASIMVPCPSGAHCHCEVRKVNNAVCEEITCSGNRPGCKCYGHCFGIPQSSVCCCRVGEPEWPGEELRGGVLKFERIFILKQQEIRISFEENSVPLKQDSASFFYTFKDPIKNFFIGLDAGNHILHIYLDSKKIVKKNVDFWFKYLPVNNYLFYISKSFLKDTILRIHVLDISSLKDKVLAYTHEDVFLLSSPFSVCKNRVVIKNGNKIEILETSTGKRIKGDYFRLPGNIKVEYFWQNTGWFLGYAGNHVYIFFNSLPYVIVLDTSLNIMKAYDFSEYEGIEEVLLKFEKEYNYVTEKGCDCTTFSISQCFTISPDKIIWIFGNLCFVLKDGEPVKQLIFKRISDNVNMVPFYVSEISSDKILLNFGNLNLTFIEKERL